MKLTPWLLSGTGALAVAWTLGGAAVGAPLGPRMSDIDNPQAATSDWVQTDDSQQAGQVVRVVMGSNGRAAKVQVKLNPSVTGSSDLVAVDAQDLAFDPSRKIVIAPMSSAQLKSNPVIPPYPQTPSTLGPSSQ